MRSNTRKKGNGGRKHTPRIGNRTEVIPHPPPASVQISHRSRLRFITTAAFAGNITWQNLLDTINVATSTITAVDLFFMVKVSRVQVWVNGLTNTSQTIELTFTGLTAGTIGDEAMHTDMSMGIEPAYVNAKPSAKSQASQWQSSSALVAWFMDIPAAAVVDVVCEFRTNLVGTGPGTQVAPAGVTAGAVYLRGLDGAAAASSKFSPVGSTNVD